MLPPVAARHRNAMLALFAAVGSPFLHLVSTAGAVQLLGSDEDMNVSMGGSGTSTPAPKRKRLQDHDEDQPANSRPKTSGDLLSVNNNDKGKGKGIKGPAGPVSIKGTGGKGPTGLGGKGAGKGTAGVKGKGKRGEPVVEAAAPKSWPVMSYSEQVSNILAAMKKAGEDEEKKYEECMTEKKGQFESGPQEQLAELLGRHFKIGRPAARPADGFFTEILPTATDDDERRDYWNKNRVQAELLPEIALNSRGADLLSYIMCRQQEKAEKSRQAVKPLPINLVQSAKLPGISEAVNASRFDDEAVAVDFDQVSDLPFCTTLRLLEAVEGDSRSLVREFLSAPARVFGSGRGVRCDNEQTMPHAWLLLHELGHYCQYLTTHPFGEKPREITFNINPQPSHFAKDNNITKSLFAVLKEGKFYVKHGTANALASVQQSELSGKNPTALVPGKQLPASAWLSLPLSEEDNINRNERKAMEEAGYPVREGYMVHVHTAKLLAQNVYNNAVDDCPQAQNLTAEDIKEETIKEVVVLAPSGDTQVVYHKEFRAPALSELGCE